jgi:prevent-host-death family protein
MKNITIKETNPTLSSLIEKVNETNQATLVTLEKNKKAVLVPLQEWNSIQETLYLLSIPGVKKDLLEGKNTNWEDCTPIEDIEW